MCAPDRWRDDPADVVDAVAAARAGGTTLILGIDGRSGSGKTELAALVAAHLPRVRVLHLDDAYPGWDGLERGLSHVAASVLAPLADGGAGRHRRWDWAADAPGEWVDIPRLAPGDLFVVEGCGALAEPCGRFLDVGVWCHAPLEVRRARALGRDGHVWADVWGRWATQEERLRYRRRADLCLRAPRTETGGRG